MNNKEDNIRPDKDTLVKTESDQRYLLLQASWHYWGEFYSGVPLSKTWKVYSDGYYTYESVSRATLEPRDNIYIYEGTLDENSFRTLCDVFGYSEWPKAYRDACDGEAWQMILFDSAGNIINTTGKIGYIYGMTVLENIGDLLRDKCRGQHLLYKDEEDQTRINELFG